MWLIFPLNASACLFCKRADARLNIITGAFVPTQQNDAVLLMNRLRHRKSILKINCKPHLINTLIKEGQAGVFIADKRALLYEAAEHLSLGHEGVKPLVGAIAALQEAYETKHVM